MIKINFKAILGMQMESFIVFQLATPTKNGNNKQLKSGDIEILQIKKA